MTLVEKVIAEIRQAVPVHRVAIYIRSASSMSMTRAVGPETLSVVGSVGIPHETFDKVRLSLSGGIGSWMLKRGRILRVEAFPHDVPPVDRALIEKEFAMMQCNVAIPISNREATIGMVLLGPPILRSHFTEDELHNVFYLLEEFGAGLQDVQLQKELARSNQILGSILSQITCGILVVSSQEEVLFANKVARELLGHASPGIPSFSEIPDPIALQVSCALQDGSLPAPFILSVPGGAGKRLVRVTLSPLPGVEARPSLVCLIEDKTELEKERQAVYAAASSRLTRILTALETEPGQDVDEMGLMNAEVV